MVKVSKINWGITEMRGADSLMVTRVVQDDRLVLSRAIICAH
jgi:hypothetical protein